MKIKGQILQVLETRKGVSQKTGRAWEITDLVIKWMDVSPTGNPYQQQLQCRFMDPINIELARNAASIGTEFDFFVNFQTDTYQNKVYNNVRLTCKELLAPNTNQNA